MMTLVPTDPVVGENELIVGAPAAAAMKFAALGCRQPESTTVIGPAVAPAGTVAVTGASLTKTSPGDDVPWNRHVASSP